MEQKEEQISPSIGMTTNMMELTLSEMSELATGVNFKPFPGSLLLLESILIKLNKYIL